jgi:hypothetical protein
MMTWIRVFEIRYFYNDQCSCFFIEAMHLCDSDAYHFAALHAGVGAEDGAGFRPMCQAKTQSQKLGITNMSWCLAREFHSK